MSWSNHTCDDCAGRTEGGPTLRDEVWETIAGSPIGAELYVSARSTLNPNQLEFDFVQDVLRNQYADYAKTEAFLCFHCIEQRLRRRLTQEDLIPGWIAFLNSGRRPLPRRTLSAHGRCDLSGLSPQRPDDTLGLCHHTTHDLPSRLDIVHQSHALPSEKPH